MFQPDLQSEAGLSILKEECPAEQVFAAVPGKSEDVWQFSDTYNMMELENGLISDVFQFVMLDLENSLYF